jgi:hypothetical protein
MTNQILAGGSMVRSIVWGGPALFACGCFGAQSDPAVEDETGIGTQAASIPMAGPCGQGGTSGLADDGPGGESTVGGAGGCRFVPIGSELRCEDAGSRVQDDTSKRVRRATEIEDCEAKCLARENCTAITDYFSEPGLDACFIRHGSCGAVTSPVWAEEDAGKEYRKVCSARGRCRLQYLGDWQRCDEGASTLEQIAGATSRADCEQACLDSPTCSSVVDYFWIGKIRGCYLYSSECSAPEPLPFGDPGVTYRKVCD